MSTHQPGPIQNPFQPNSFQISLHQTGVLLETDHAPFLDYARAYLADLAASPAEVLVHSRFHWNEQPPVRWQRKSVLKRGRRLLQDDQALLISEVVELPGLKLELRWEAGVMEVDAYFQPISRLDSVVLNLGKAQKRLFAVCIYYLVYFPLLYHFYQQRGWHVLHAGGVVGPSASWLLAGLPGSGKSTFTLSLLGQPETRLLSDNLLLYDDRQVYAFPEPLHLSSSSLEMVDPAVKKLLQNTERDFSYDRKDYLPLPALRRWQAEPEALFILSTSNRFRSMPLAAELALERLLAFDLLAKETTAYAQFAAALDLVAAGETQGQQRSQSQRQSLRSLLSRLDSVELTLPLGRPDQAVRWVCEGKYRAEEPARPPASERSNAGE